MYPQQQQQSYLQSRHYIFFGLLTLLFLLCFIESLHWLIEWIQGTLFNSFLIYVAWNTSYFLYDFVESFQILPKNRLSDPEKRAVLITGCDSGFGLYLAETLQEQGYPIFAGCLSLTSYGAQKLKLKQTNNARILLLEMNVANNESVQKSLEKVEAFLQLNPDVSLWAIVNNAGIMSLSEIEFGDMTIFTKQVEVNGIGVVRVTKQFLPLLRRNHFGRGRVVNMASLAGRFTMPGFVGYCMSKAMVIAFSDGLRRELAKWNIEVVSIEPHLYKTNLVNQERFSTEFESQWNQTKESIKKDYGRPYHEGFIRTMTQAMDTARIEIEQVVRTMEQAVTRTQVEYYYIVARYSERIRIWFWQTVAPVSLIDFFMKKILTDCNGQPKMLATKDWANNPLVGSDNKIK